MGQEDPPGEGNGSLLQYSCPELNLMHGGAWQATVHGVAALDMTGASKQAHIPPVPDTVVTVLHIRSSDLIYYISESWYPFVSISDCPRL